MLLEVKESPLAGSPIIILRGPNRAADASHPGELLLLAFENALASFGNSSSRSSCHGVSFGYQLIEVKKAVILD